MELVRAWGVFKLSSVSVLVRNSTRLIALGNATVGPRMTTWILKKTFFGHFCGGEKAEEVYPVMDKLRAAGIGSILDYAAEADVEAEAQKAGGGGGHDAAAAVVDPEKECDLNMGIFLSCVDTAGARENGFAAIKLTALGKPEFLERVSVILREITTLFNSFVTVEGDQEVTDCRISLVQFHHGIRKLGLGTAEISDEDIELIFRRMDTDRSGYIEYLEWIEYLQFSDLTTRPFFTSGYKGPRQFIPRLTPEELRQMENMMKRLEAIAEAAAKKRVRLMIDAEQTYFQSAIDHFVVNLQRKYNRNFPVIFNTYQCYLKDSGSRVKFDLARAKKEGFIFAAKTVRGAYMIQERKRAGELGYPDPIQPNIEATHANYNKLVQVILSAPQTTELMVASHNEESVRQATSFMET